MPELQVHCPICKEIMQKRKIPQGLIIDYCDEHGVWLDVGELEAIAASSVGSSGGSGQDESLLKTVGKGLGRSAVFGAGATIGHRIVGGLIDSVFGN